MEPIGVVVAHDDRGVIEQVGASIEADGALFVAGTSAAAARPGQVILAGGEPLAALEPGAVPVVALADGDPLRAARAAIAAGARDIVRWPDERERLAGSIRRAATGTDPAGERGALVAVAGSRGGVGASTVAACLAARLGESVVLDLDPAGCGQRAWCAGEPPRTLADLALADLSPEALEPALASHAGGVRCAHAGPWAPVPDGRALHGLLRASRSLAPVVIADCGLGDPALAPLLSSADARVLVVGNDVPSVRGARALLDRFAGPWTFVVRRAQRSGVPLRDLAAVLGAPPAAVIPNDGPLARACDLGRLPGRPTRSGRAMGRAVRAVQDVLDGR